MLATKQIPRLKKIQKPVKRFDSIWRFKNPVKPFRKIKQSFNSFLRITDVLKQDFDFKADLNYKIDKDLEA